VVNVFGGRICVNVVALKLFVWKAPAVDDVTNVRALSSSNFRSRANKLERTQIVQRLEKSTSIIHHCRKIFISISLIVLFISWTSIPITRKNGDELFIAFLPIVVLAPAVLSASVSRPFSPFLLAGQLVRPESDDNGNGRLQ
jgi:hypothetical protein